MSTNVLFCHFKKRIRWFTSHALARFLEISQNSGRLNFVGFQPARKSPLFQAMRLPDRTKKGGDSMHSRR